MSIILKEAFRHQNFLNTLLDKALYYLNGQVNFMLITEEHLRSEVVPDAKNEVKDNISERALSVTPEAVINFIMKVYEEKNTLSKAINDAKINHCKEMDMRMSMNKVRNQIINTLKGMVHSKEREQIVKGSAYTFNAEGNQVQYYYDIKKTIKVDFDRVAVKRIVSSASKEADNVSTTIDYWMSSIPVDYTPVFDINDTFEELVETMPDKLVVS